MAVRAAHVVAGIIALATLHWSGAGEARGSKPKALAGRDPGGIAVAVVGRGLDYRLPGVAMRLARDGEGEPIGWDLADNDARPFAASDDDGPAAGIVLAEGPATRLVLVRAAAGRQEQIAAGLRFAAQTPARIVLLVADPGLSYPLAGLAEAARHLPQLLIVVPAWRVASEPASPIGDADRGGLLSVAADGGTASADATVQTATLAQGIHPDDAAAARVAALAARLLAVEPSLAGASLRARLLSLAKPQPSGPPAIPDARRLLGRE